MDQFQGITYPYPYVNPYDNSFSRRVRQMAATSPATASMQGWGLDTADAHGVQEIT